MGEAPNSARVVRLTTYQADARICTHCREHDLLHVDERHGMARPILQREPTGHLGILVVGEAPNWEDTFLPDKGYLTYDATTDPTGRFMHSLLLDEVGLAETEIDQLLFTNAVLCLPSEESGKHRVTRKQLGMCTPWLIRLIEDAEAEVVVAMGATALRALNRIEHHRLTLKSSVGKLHPWFGRHVLPLYHPGLLGRVTRSAEQQREDIRALRDWLATKRATYKTARPPSRGEA